MLRYLFHTVLLALLTGLNSGCTTGSGSSAPIEAHSLLGMPLVRPSLSEVQRTRYEANLADAQVEFADALESEDATIWLGRRTAYLGRYREAIAIYSRGLDRHPDSYRLLRHRGHRWITLREFERAEADLSRATVLIHGVPDETEADGLPNARNIPTSTTHTNIYYHLGLVHYLQAEFSDALDAYRACMAFAKNDDMRVATAYWMFLTLVRLDQFDDAHAVLAPITPEMEIIENHEYHRLLLAFKGHQDTLDELNAAIAAGDVAGATAAYGLARRHAAHGEHDRARTMLEQIVTGDSWAAFGYIAAEADLARLREES